MKDKLAPEDLDKVLGILIEKNQDFDDLVFDLSNFLEIQAENNEASGYHRLCTFFKEHSFRASEKKVFILAAKGLANKEIAETLCVSKNTVKFHLKNIYRKAPINGRISLIKHGSDLGL
ncbi:MAG: helix-turn-helix transcriptional regulator [Actinobacteria bacterium]|nr:helix-turn-helix transcriptional regulator [Actinomycetota bacterium]